MRTFATVLLVLPMLILAAPALALVKLTQEAGSAEAKELKEFQGKWEATAFIIGGVPAPEEQLQHTTLAITGKKFVFQTKTTKIEGELTIDPSKSPKLIDTTGTTPDGVEVKLEGIYQWTEGKRKSCFALPNHERPGDFLQKKGYVILEWKKK